MILRAKFGISGKWPKGLHRAFGDIDVRISLYGWIEILNFKPSSNAFLRLSFTGEGRLSQVPVGWFPYSTLPSRNVAMIWIGTEKPSIDIFSCQTDFLPSYSENSHFDISVFPILVWPLLNWNECQPHNFTPIYISFQNWYTLNFMFQLKTKFREKVMLKLSYANWHQLNQSS